MKSWVFFAISHNNYNYIFFSSCNKFSVFFLAISHNGSSGNVADTDHKACYAECHAQLQHLILCKACDAPYQYVASSQTASTTVQ